MPWDRKQTFQSLRNLTIEETHELADAIPDETGWDQGRNWRPDAAHGFLRQDRR